MSPIDDPRPEAARIGSGRSIHRRTLLWALASGGVSLRTWAQDRPATAPAEVLQALGLAARLHGVARLRVLGLLIYDSRLWVTPGFEAHRFEASPLALELTYARSLNGAAIAERSLEEMRRGGPIAQTDSQRWLAFMTESFPDVKAGDRLCGMWNPAEGRSVFFFNGTPGKGLTDRAFGPRFFGIWLAEHSSQPEMRHALLGRSPS